MSQFIVSVKKKVKRRVNPSFVISEKDLVKLKSHLTKLDNDNKKVIKKKKKTGKIEFLEEVKSGGMVKKLLKLIS